jgi:hypothetical protein
MPEPTTTLTAIETKVRRLTRSPSLAQLSKEELDNYINTFVVYDFPEHLRTFNLRKQFTFICNPFQDTYRTDALLPTANQLYDFQNKYLTVHPPVYVAGFQILYTQSRQELFGIYPQINSIAGINATGDGVTTQYTGVVNAAQSNTTGITGQAITLIQNQVLFSSVDSNGNGIAMVDVPVIDGATGNPTINGNLYPAGQTPATSPTVIDPTNTINYYTGAYTVTFPVAPGSGVAINSQTVPTQCARPQALLFYENKFTLRPVPDQPYRINFEVFARPTALLQDSQSPELNEWWQYIAYGAAKKIFEDRMDTESVQQIMPEFKNQEALCLRRTIVQNTNNRTSTIYTDQLNRGYNGSWWWGGYF